MAAALFAEIEARHDIRLPMTVILEDSTVARLARRIAVRESQAPQVSLKPLRTGRGNARNLFLVHDGDGETLLYANLARRLPPDVSVYGIEPLGTPRVPIRHTRIEDMARHYVAEIRRVQPAGPYLLGGMCAGGVLAFEIGLQLEQAGEQVGLLSLLDSAEPHAARKQGLATKRRWQSFVNAIGRRTARAGDTEPPAAANDDIAAHAQATDAVSVAERMRAAAGKVRNVISYEATRQLNKLSSQARFRFLRQALDNGVPIPSWLQQLSVRTVYDLAAREYLPRARLRGPVVLFRATHGTGGDEPFVQLYADPQLGWAERIERALAIHEMPGGHASMLQEPHVKAMAERMSELLTDRLRQVT